VLAARNVVPPTLLRRPIKRFFDAVRGVDALIWALIWINVVGLGPFAGVLAIATSDFGALGKLFAEIIESADRKQPEGVRAAGGRGLAGVRFGLMPQVLPVIAGQILYFIESNTRSATIIGVVGAGGIGLYLSEQIRVLEWKQVSFLIVLILLSVAGEIRFGEAAVEMFIDDLGFAVSIGDIAITECQMVNQFTGGDGRPARFTRGYGLAFGQSERKAMSMALVDRALRADEFGEERKGPAQDEEFVLSHSDNVQATGFVEHLKLPHYVDFQAELALLRQLRRDGGAVAEAAE